jgi:hypothetical protein
MAMNKTAKKQGSGKFNDLILGEVIRSCPQLKENVIDLIWSSLDKVDAHLPGSLPQKLCDNFRIVSPKVGG